MISPDGDQGTDPFQPLSSAQPTTDAAPAPETVASTTASTTAGSEPPRPRMSVPAAIVVAVGAVLALAGFFVLDWADGGVSFGDIRDVAGNLRVETLVELYLDFAAFLGLATAVVLAGVAVAVPARTGSRPALTVPAAVVAGGAAVYHAYVVPELFVGPADPSLGAWLPVVGYLVMIAGLVVGPLTAAPAETTRRMPSIAGPAAIGLLAIIGVVAAVVVVDDDAVATPDTGPGLEGSGPKGSDSGEAASTSPAGGSDSANTSPAGADDAAIDGLMTSLDGDNNYSGATPQSGSPADQLGEFLDSAGNGGQRSVNRQGDTVEVCGAGLGSTCLELSNFVLDDSGFSIVDMDINGERLGARIRLDTTAVPPANPGGVISITSKGQLLVPDGPTIVVLVLKQYDERIPQANGCDGATASLSTAGPATTHQGGGVDRGSLLGNTMVLNFPTTASVGGTLEMDCYTADGATEHHTVNLPG